MFVWVSWGVQKYAIYFLETARFATDQSGQQPEYNTINWRDTTHFDSEHDYRTGCRSVSHCEQQQSYSGLRSPRRSNSTYFYNEYYKRERMFLKTPSHDLRRSCLWVVARRDHQHPSCLNWKTSTTFLDLYCKLRKLFFSARIYGPRAISSIFLELWSADSHLVTIVPNALSSLVFSSVFEIFIIDENFLVLKDRQQEKDCAQDIQSSIFSGIFQAL